MSKYWEKIKCPVMGDKLSKLRYIHTTEYCIAIKKNYDDKKALIILA